MDIKVGSLQYSLEEAFNIFSIECHDDDKDEEKVKFLINMEISLFLQKHRFLLPIAC